MTYFPWKQQFHFNCVRNFRRFRGWKKARTVHSTTVIKERGIKT